MGTLDNFRKKYPGYDDLGDTELAVMLAKKYPDAYSDLPDEVGDNKQGVLPKAGETESLIGRRTTAVQSAKEALSEMSANPTLGATMNPTSAKLMSSVMNYPREVAQSWIAAPVYEALRGNAKGIPSAMKSAMTQEKPTQIGDIVRGTGVGGKYNNWIAATTGVVAELGAIDVIAKKSLQKGMTDIGKVIFGMRPLNMNDTYLKTMSRTAYNAINTAKDSVGSQLTKFFGKYGDDAVDSNRFRGLLDKVPTNIKNYIADEMRIDLDDVPTGVTVNGVRKVKQLIGDFVNDADWAKKAKDANETINFKKAKKAYGLFAEFLDDSLTKSAGRIKARQLIGINNKFERVSTIGRAIKKKLVDETGEPVKTKALISMMKDKEEAGGRDLINRMGEFTTGVAKAAKMANDYVTRERIKEVGLYMARVGGLGGVLYAGRHEISKRIAGEG